MLNKTDYAREQEEKHRRKVVLPCVIPWEYGTNKYASQKGSSAFGALRNATTSITSSRQLSESNDGVVPWISCPPLRDKELASQSGLTPFGSIREHIAKAQDKEGEGKKEINKLVKDHSSESMLTIWSQPNPLAKASQPFGKQRDAVTHMVGGRRFSAKELAASRAAIPRFQDPRETLAEKAKRATEERRSRQGSAGTLQIPPAFVHDALPISPRSIDTYASPGMQSQRGALTVAEGADGSEQEELDSSRYMAWLGGQVTLQSQPRVGLPQKPKDVVSTSYYDRVMSERKPTKREIHERLETERRSREEESNKEWITEGEVGGEQRDGAPSSDRITACELSHQAYNSQPAG